MRTKDLFTITDRLKMNYNDGVSWLAAFMPMSIPRDYV